MSIENRDWYRDKLRQAEGYIERAAFRVNLGGLAKERARGERVSGWWRLARIVLALCFWAWVLLSGFRWWLGRS